MPSTKEVGHCIFNALECYTVLDLGDVATKETQTRFGYNGHNDKSDAFRHCYWSALLTKEFGVVRAFDVLSRHENFATNPVDELFMDMRNNLKGMEIANKTPSSDPKVLANTCYKALSSGLVKIK